MLSPNTDVLISESMFSCSSCGAAIKPKTQMTSDAPMVCANCRCRHCGIVLSTAVCRCGARHGRPSRIERLCERCYGLMGLDSHVEPAGTMAHVPFAADDIFFTDDMEDIDDLSDEKEGLTLEDDLEGIETFVA